MASCRKDVECLFGILKKRFRILRCPILFNQEESINNLFKACCVFHNMLLEWDGLADLGTNDEDWIARDSAEVAEVSVQPLQLIL